MKIFFRSKIKSLNYEVSVIDSIAYVIGIAEDQNPLMHLIPSLGTYSEIINSLHEPQASEEDVATLIGLLHDIGRFEQFIFTEKMC